MKKIIFGFMLLSMFSNLGFTQEPGFGTKYVYGIYTMSIIIKSPEQIEHEKVWNARLDQEREKIIKAKALDKSTLLEDPLKSYEISKEAKSAITDILDPAGIYPKAQTNQSIMDNVTNINEALAEFTLRCQNGSLSYFVRTDGEDHPAPTLIKVLLQNGEPVGSIALMSVKKSDGSVENKNFFCRFNVGTKQFIVVNK